MERSVAVDGQNITGVVLQHQVPVRPDDRPPDRVLDRGVCGGGVVAGPAAALAVPKVIRPGLPPVSVSSVTAIRATPFSRNVILDPIATSVSTVPAGSGGTA